MVAAFILIATLLAGATMASTRQGDDQQNVFNSGIATCTLPDGTVIPRPDNGVCPDNHLPTCELPDGTVVVGECPPDPEPPTNGGDCIGDATQAAHFARLMELDPYFRSGGWEGWMKAAGFTWDAVQDARQPEEETYDPDFDGTGNDYVAGLQIVATNVEVYWPNAVTTDTPTRITETDTTEKILAAQNTGSTVYTNVIANGPVTVYADATNWGQLASVLGCENGTGVKPGTPDGDGDPATGDLCLSEKQLVNRYGIVRDTIGDAKNGILYDKGVAAGALLKFDQLNPLRLNNRGWYVTGDKSAGYLPAWAPHSCYPMELN